jgi:lipopolysaccharide/colanic/teichoic acid biosynthesis glycosyltransferase
MVDVSSLYGAASPRVGQGRADRAESDRSEPDIAVGGSPAFWATKRGLDVTVAMLGLPFVAVMGLVLLVLNPFWNRGRLLYRQRRMGRFGREMTVWKFRTMLDEGDGERGPEDPVEAHRITPLGGWLRRTRLDELPQFVNVLVGQMSLIGPRPDTVDHARVYARAVPGYRKRHVVRPGISGYAQVRLGYAEGFELTARKTRLDLLYIRRAGWRFEYRVLRRTFWVMATGFGAR